MNPAILGRAFLFLLLLALVIAGIYMVAQRYGIPAINAFLRKEHKAHGKWKDEWGKIK